MALFRAHLCAHLSDEHYFACTWALARYAASISIALSVDSGSEGELPSLDHLPPEITSAVQFYWETRSGQAKE